MNINMQSTFVALKLEEPKEQVVGGIVLVSSVAPDASPISEVVAIGPDVKDVKVGDKVIHLMGAGHEMTMVKEKFLMIKEAEILAVVSE